MLQIDWKSLIFGFFFGMLIYLAFLSASTLSPGAIKLIDCGAVLLGALLLFFRKKFSAQWQKTIEYTSVMAPGIILLTEIGKQIVHS